MMTSRNDADRHAMYAILANLYAINSFYAYQDYRKANPNGREYDKRGREKPLKSYTLSPLTIEAREHYKLAQQMIWTDETETKIKAYQLRLRTSGELDKILEWETAQNRPNPWRKEVRR